MEPVRKVVRGFQLEHGYNLHQRVFAFEDQRPCAGGAVAHHPGRPAVRVLHGLRVRHAAPDVVVIPGARQNPGGEIVRPLRRFPADVLHVLQAGFVHPFRAFPVCQEGAAVAERGVPGQFPGIVQRRARHGRGAQFRAALLQRHKVA